MPRRPAATIAVCLFCIGASACLGRPADPDEDVLHDPGQRAERIQSLREAIDQDHAKLEHLVSEPRSEDAEEVYADPEVRAIAARMTAQVRRLERLEALQKAEQGEP